MDAYEATRIVLSRIQSLDPENASKIMGILLIQDHGEKEMIRLAFGPDALLQSVVLKARKDLGLLPPSAPSTPSSPSPSPFLLARQNSASRLLGGGGGGSGHPSPSSWAPPPVFSRNSSSNGNGAINDAVDDLHLQGADELISSSSTFGVSLPSSSSSCSSSAPFFGGDLIDEFQLHDQLSFLNDPAAAASSPGSHHALQIGPKGNGDLFYTDMAGDCRSPSSNGDAMLFPYAGMAWGTNSSHHRRSYSAADRCLSSDICSDFGWRPCLYFARGYCKNGSSCRFLHGLPDDAVTATAAMAAGAKIDAMMEQQFHELMLRSKSQRLGSSPQLMATAASFPYSPSPVSPSSGKCMSFLLHPSQQQNESQRVAAAAAAAAAALSLGGEEPHKFGRSRLERGDYAGGINPGSRQIYLTFPADSTFREEDVANYFSIYGPVQDVRIPYQQKRMFGFVTFVYPETVKLILAKGNPHFVCDARVLVKPYKEKGKVPDKKQQQQQADRGVFSGCPTPTGLDSKDPYDLQLLGASMLYSGQEALLRKKLEEQQQAVELQQAIELQRRRFMGLHLLDLKNRNLSSPALPGPINTTAAGSVPTADASSPSAPDGSAEGPPQQTDDKCLSAPASAGAAATIVGAQAAGATTGAATAPAAAADKLLNTHAFLPQPPVNAAAPGADKEDAALDGSPKEDGDFQERQKMMCLTGGEIAEHNLPDSPFASPPTNCCFAADAFSLAEAEGSLVPDAGPNNSDGCIGAGSNNNSHLITSSLLPAPSTLDMASFNSCFFPLARYSSGHGAVGM